jgi:hypothetical protein
MAAWKPPITISKAVMKNLIILSIIIYISIWVINSLSNTVINTSAHIVAYHATQAEVIDQL